MKKIIGNLLILTFLFSGIPELIAETPSGLSFGLGCGLFTPDDKYYYVDNDAGIHVEVNACFDIYAFKIGGNLGYTSDTGSETESSSAGPDYHYVSSKGISVSYIIKQFEIGVLPLRIMKPKSSLQPFFACGFGNYNPRNDTKEQTPFYESIPCWSLKIGIEKYWNNVVGYFDIRHLFAEYSFDTLEYNGQSWVETSQTANLGITSFMLGLSYRLPLKIID